MDPYGLMVLLVALVLVSACLTAGLYGAMYAVHKYAGNRIPDHSYRNFDFDHVRKEQLSEFLVHRRDHIFRDIGPSHFGIRRGRFLHQGLSVDDHVCTVHS